MGNLKTAGDPDMSCECSSPVAETTDGRLNCFVGLRVKVSSVEGPGCWSSTTKDICSHLVVLVAVAAKNLWHKCGNGTTAPRKCSFLGLMGPFL